MAQHLIFDGDHSICSKWLPFARKEMRKLKARRATIQGYALTHTLNLHDAFIFLSSVGTEDQIRIWGFEFGTYEFFTWGDTEPYGYIHQVSPKYRHHAIHRNTDERNAVLAQNYPNIPPNIWHFNSGFVVCGLAPRGGYSINSQFGVNMEVFQSYPVVHIGKQTFDTAPPTGYGVAAAIQGKYIITVSAYGYVCVWPFAQTEGSIPYAEAQLPMSGFSWSTYAEGQVPGNWVFNRAGNEVATPIMTQPFSGVAGLRMGYVRYSIVVDQNTGVPTVELMEDGMPTTAPIFLDFNYETAANELVFGSLETRYTKLGGDYEYSNFSQTLIFNSERWGEIQRIPLTYSSYISFYDPSLFEYRSNVSGVDARYRAATYINYNNWKSHNPRKHVTTAFGQDVVTRRDGQYTEIPRSTAPVIAQSSSQTGYMHSLYNIFNLVGGPYVHPDVGAKRWATCSTPWTTSYSDGLSPLGITHQGIDALVDRGVLVGKHRDLLSSYDGEVQYPGVPTNWRPERTTWRYPTNEQISIAYGAGWATERPSIGYDDSVWDEVYG